LPPARGLWQKGRVTPAERGRRDAALAEYTPVLAISLAALALRLTHLRAVRPLVIDQPGPEGMDRWLNVRVAEAIAGGDWLGGWAVPFDSSPAYSYVLAGLYRICGERWVGPVLIQLILGAVTPLLLYAVVRRVRGHAAGVVAALLAALYLPAIFYEGLLVKFSLVPVMVALALYTLLRVREGRARWALAAGAVLGGLTLLRPNTILVAPILLGWAVWSAPLPTACRRAALVVVGAALLLVPMAVRDHVAARRGHAAALGGIHFYIGTNPHADGEYVVLDGIRPDIVGHVVDARREAERRLGHQLTPAEVSHFWFQQGLAFIREHPGRYAMLQLRKLWFALEAGESGSFGDDFEALRPASPVLRMPLVTFGTVLPLGLIGLYTCLRHGPLLMPLFVAGFLASLLPFFVAGRYRLPLAPAMIVLAAVGLADVEPGLRRLGIPALVMTAIGLSLIGILFGARDVELLTLLGVLVIGVALLRWFSPVHPTPMSREP
jgi:4-amino-4-deoxy-L-arabinose transferase-like glycosyltransferase